MFCFKKWLRNQSEKQFPQADSKGGPAISSPQATGSFLGTGSSAFEHSLCSSRSCAPTPGYLQRGVAEGARFHIIL